MARFRGWPARERVASYTVKTPALDPSVENIAGQLLRRAGLAWSGPHPELVMDAAILLAESGIAVDGIVKTHGSACELIPLVFPTGRRRETPDV